MWSQSPQPSFAQLTGKRKANELTCSGGLLEPANRRPAPSDGSEPLPKRASAVTGEHAASCSRQLVSPEVGVTYAAVLAGSVAQLQPSGPAVSKVRSITELCGLRVPVETYVAPKSAMQCKRCQRFERTQPNCGYAPRYVACGGSHLSVGCSTPREQPQCCGCGVTTRLTTGSVLSGKMRRQPLESKRPSVSERSPPQASPPLRKLSVPGPLPSRWTWARSGITSCEEGVLSRSPPIHPKTQSKTHSLTGHGGAQAA